MAQEEEMQRKIEREGNTSEEKDNGFREKKKERSPSRRYTLIHNLNE